jgi:uncharacterized protein YggT (Ycf19 family)
MFRGVRWMQIGNLDFSPAVSIGLLYALSTILSNIAMTGRIYFGGIIAIIISMFWSIFASLHRLSAHPAYNPVHSGTYAKTAELLRFVLVAA